MSTRRVILSDNIKRKVRMEVGATVGATIGVNLFGPDGNVLTIEQLRNLLGGGEQPEGPDGEFASTIWQLIQEIPPNIQQIALLTGDGFAFRNPDGTWALRQDVQLVRRYTFAFGDSSPRLLFDVERNLEVSSACIEITTPFNGTGAALSIGDSDDDEGVFPSYAVNPAEVGIYESATKYRIDEDDQVIMTITPGAGASQGAGIATISLNRR